MPQDYQLVINKMNIDNQSAVKTKNITLGGVIAWIVGVCALIVGVISVFSAPVSGLVFLLIASITLPPLSKFVKDKTKINVSKGLKFVLVVILLIVAGSAMPKTPEHAVAKKETPKVVKEAIKVTAVTLVADYKANEVAADAKYKNNLVEVSGIVKNIGKDIVDNPYITLSDGEQYSITSVQCMFSKSDEVDLAKVSQGERITLQGEVSGKLGNVLLNDCSIIK